VPGQALVMAEDPQAGWWASSAGGRHHLQYSLTACQHMLRTHNVCCLIRFQLVLVVITNIWSKDLQCHGWRGLAVCGCDAPSLSAAYGLVAAYPFTAFLLLPPVLRLLVLPVVSFVVATGIGAPGGIVAACALKSSVLAAAPTACCLCQ